MIDNFTIYQGGSYNEATLFDAERFGGVNTDFRLDDSIINYDTLIVITKETDGLHSYYIPTSEFYKSLNDSTRRWSNDNETLFLFPTSDIDISVSASGTTVILKVLGVSNKHTRSEEEEETSVQLTAAGITALKEYLGSPIYETTFNKLNAVSSTALKYIDYSDISGGGVPRDYDNLPMVRYDYTIDQFKEMATPIQTTDIDSPLYVYNDGSNSFYYCERPIKITNDDLEWIKYIWVQGFNLCLRDLNTSSLTNIDYLFDGTIRHGSNPIVDVTNWDVSNVTSAIGTFENFNYPSYDFYIIGVQTWDTSNFKNTSEMFYFSRTDSYSWNRYISSLENWDVTNVINADHMFDGFYGEYIPLNLNFKNCKSMVGTLANVCWSTEYDDRAVLNWKTPKVRDMSYMFSNTVEDEDYFDVDDYPSFFDLDNLDTSNVENMESMFRNYVVCSNDILDFTQWDVSNVENMSHMFYNTTAYKDSRSSDQQGIDISNWDTAYVTDMSYMFSCCNTSTYYTPSSFTIIGLDTINVHNVLDFTHMLSKPDDNSLSYGHVIEFDSYDFGNWDMRKARNISHMFENRDLSNTTLGFENWNTSNISDFTDVFENVNIENLDLSNWDFTNVSDNTKELLAYTMNGLGQLDASGWDLAVYNPDMLQFIGYYTGAVAIDVTNWDVTKIHSLEGLFKNLNLSGITGLDTWDVSNIYNVSRMFESIALDTLNLSGWNLSECTNFDDMFEGTDINNLNLSNWIISSAFSFKDAGIPSGDHGLILNVSNWNLSNITSLKDFFKDTAANNSYDLEGLDTWNTATITDMSSLFENGDELIYLDLSDLSNWDTSNVTNMSKMFKNCSFSSFTALNNWDISSCQNFTEMLKVDTTISEGDYPTWNGYWDNDGTFYPNDGTIVTTMYFKSVVDSEYSMSDNTTIGNAYYLYDNGSAKDGVYIWDGSIWVSPQHPLQSLTADYTQSYTIYPDSPWGDIANDLQVTIYMQNGFDQTLDFYNQGYELSGELTVGTSTITVSSHGLTDTIEVIVTDDSE